MKLEITIILKAVIYILGLVVLALCIFVLPQGYITEDMLEIKGIIIGMYLATIPFYIGLYQTLQLLKYIEEKKAFSEYSVNSLRNIRNSALAISIIYTATLPLIYIWADRDDAPGLVVVGLILTGAPIVVATFAAVLQKILQDAIDIKSDNDLTV